MIPHVSESKNDFEEIDLQYNKDKTNNIKWYRKIILNRPLKVLICMTLIGILAPVLLYQFMYYARLDLASPDGFSLGSCLVPRSSRLLCGSGNISIEDCHQQCCYDHSNNMCFHRFPSRFSYIMDQYWNEAIFLKPRVATVPFKSQKSLTNIRMSLDEVSASHLTITFYNSAVYNFTGQRIGEKKYDYQIESPELNVVVNASQGIVFNTVRGPLIASENIWEIGVKLTDESMYGFGQIPIKNGTVQIIYNHQGGLSSIPLVYAKINESYHGLLIDTIDPTEVRFKEDNVIVFRSITNFGIKFHLFVGPKPTDVMDDVRKHIGFDKGIEYWMLGAHICSEFLGSEIGNNISDFIQEASTYNIPFESHCVTPIVFDDVCETQSVSNINEGAIILKSAGKKFIPHVSPYILYKTIENNDTQTNETKTKEVSSNCTYNIREYSEYMIQQPKSTGMYKGLVGNDQVIYPDFENYTLLIEQLWLYTKDIDGIILENNWPLDESDKLVNETNQHLPYFSEYFEEAFLLTPPWNAKKTNGEKYLYTHNNYGNSFSKAFENLTSSPIGASSQWMDGNVYINRQDIETSWTNLHKELIEAALGGTAGHWLWSSPVCGDTDIFSLDTHSSLCVKWYLAATYMPMIKIHSKNATRDPLSFPGTQRTIMINALNTRLMLAPYFYTTLQKGPLLRPMFYQFPASAILKDLTTQFSVGDDLLIVPNLQPWQSMVHVIMPPGVWYELWSGLKINSKEGQAVTMATTEADLLTLIRGGSIIVTQKDISLTAETTRSQSNLTLTIALKCDTSNNTRAFEQNNSTNCTATGDLYMHSNATIHFEADGENLLITSKADTDLFCGDNPTWSRWIQELNVYGLEDEMNNYDTMKYISTAIDLCELISQETIVFNYI